MDLPDISVAIQDPQDGRKYEAWDVSPHLNISSVTKGEGWIELELEPAGDMGEGRQQPHCIRLSDPFVANFHSVEWAARYALLQAVVFALTCEVKHG